MNQTPVSEYKTAPADSIFLPGPVLLLGAPGVGKGTQAQALMAEFGIPQISTGDILRGNIARGTPLGVKAKGLMAQGLFVDDATVNTMVADRLGEPDAAHGFILDGFPRTLVQARWLDGFLSEGRTGVGTSQSAVLPIVALSIELSYDELLRRVTGRRTCPVCKSIYNIYSNAPKVTGQCDLEGAALIQRPDDTEAVFAERMKTFDAQTAPVVEHYRQQGRFKQIKGDRPVHEVTAEILATLHAFRAAK